MKTCSDSSVFTELVVEWKDFCFDKLTLGLVDAAEITCANSRRRLSLQSHFSTDWHRNSALKGLQ